MDLMLARLDDSSGLDATVVAPEIIVRQSTAPPA
jgi:hypothetical protein